MKAIVLSGTKDAQGKFTVALSTVPKPSVADQPGGVLVKLHAAALNHRDEFIRQAR